VQAALLAAEDTTLGAAVLLAGPLMRGDSATIAQARMSVSRANAELSAFPEARSAYTSAVARGVELLRSGLDSAAADRILVAERDSVIARIRRRAGRDTVWLYEDAGAKQGYFAARRLLSSWWMRGGYLSARPAAALAHGRVPVLALYGDADAQVAVPENVAALRAALAGRDTSGWSVETIAGLDHAFATPIPDVRWHTISPEAIRSQAAYDRALMDETSARAREVWRSFDARVMDRIAAWITRWCVAPSRR
jgi:hypothetical protein